MTHAPRSRVSLHLTPGKFLFPGFMPLTLPSQAWQALGRVFSRIRGSWFSLPPLQFWPLGPPSLKQLGIQWDQAPSRTWRTLATCRPSRQQGQGKGAPSLVPKPSRPRLAV